MSGGGNIRVMMDIAGVDDARRAADELTRLRQAAAQLQQMTSGPFQEVVGPMQGLGQGRMDDEAHLRVVTDMWKQVQGLNTELTTYYQNVLNIGNAYGYQRDQMIAVRQEFQALQSIQAQAGAQQASLGFARAYGMDPTQVAGGLGSFYQMGAVTPGNQQQFLEMLSSAVARGSQGGMNIMMERFLPILQSLAQSQLMATPTGVNVAGIATTLTRFNQSGIPGFRDEGAMRAYQGVDQAIRGASTGLPGAILYDAMAQGNPGYDYAQYLQDISQGASNPDTQRKLLTSIYRMGPQGNSQQAQNWRAVYAQSVMPNMDVATLKALFTTYFDASGNYIPDQDLSGLGAKYGTTSATDPTVLPLLAKLDAARTPQDIQGVLQSYKDLAGGTGLNYTPTGNVAQDQQAIGRLLAGQTTPLMGTQADRMDKATADMQKAFEDAAHQMFELNQSVRELNVHIANAVRGTLNPDGPLQRAAPFMPFGLNQVFANPGGALFGASMLGQVASGALSGVGSLATFGVGLRALRWLMPGATAAAPGVAPAVAPTAAAAGGGFLPEGLGITAGGLLGGGMSALAPLAGLAGVLGIEGAANTWGAGQAAQRGSVLPTGFAPNMALTALATGPLSSFFAPLVFGRTALNFGREHGIDLPSWTNNIPGFAGIFGASGQQRGQEQQDKAVDTLDKIYNELVKQNQADSFANVYDELVKAGTPTGVAYDYALQKVYGGGGSPAEDRSAYPPGFVGPIVPGSTPAGPGAAPQAAPNGGYAPPVYPNAAPGTAAAPYGPTASTAQAVAADPRSGAYRAIIEREAQAGNVDPDIVQAIIMQESGGNANAVAPNDGGPGVDAMGLMQVESNSDAWPPGISRQQMLDPATNIRAGIAVLNGKRGTVRQKFGNLDPREEMHRTLAAYNGSLDWGTGQTTTNYASSVEGNVSRIKGPQPGTGASVPGPQALRAAPSDTMLAQEAAAGLGQGGGGDTAAQYDFVGRVELEVLVNGSPNGQAPVLEFGRSGTNSFARIINAPRGGGA